MDDTTLARRIAALEPPQPDLARERAVDGIAARLRAARDGGSSRLARLSPRLVTALAALLVVSACFALLTPPGQALTSWVGERLGFGEPGGHPTLRQLRASWGRGTAAEGQPAYVLAVGPVPRGGRYEFITYWPHQPPGSAGHWKLEGPCFELDLTQERSSYNQGCGVLPEGPDLFVAGIGGNAMPGRETFYFSGRTSARVSTVEARLGDRPVAVETVPIPAPLIARFHLGRPFNFFIAFLNRTPRGGPLTVTARDAAGKILARHRTRTFDLAVMRETTARAAARLRAQR